MDLCSTERGESRESGAEAEAAGFHICAMTFTFSTGEEQKERELLQPKGLHSEAQTVLHSGLMRMPHCCTDTNTHIGTHTHIASSCRFIVIIYLLVLACCTYFSFASAGKTVAKPAGFV